MQTSKKITVYLEIGQKQTFAGAVEWPGWCRSGRDEQAALQALVAYGPRYAHLLRTTPLGFQAPVDATAFAVVERLEGNMTTDFGAPDRAPTSDAAPIGDAEFARLQAILQAAWQAFDAAVELAQDKALRTGPRGGGRDLEKLAQHVMGAEAGYLPRLAWKHKKNATADLPSELKQTRQAVLDAFTNAVHGELPAQGPRGGVIWLPRYFVRRVAWHVLDHAWEIEDRIQ